MNNPLTASSRCKLSWMHALLGLVIAGAAAGCQPDAPADRAVGSTPDASAGGEPVAVTDLLGRQLTFETPPQRIVSLSPAITEVLFAIGVGDRVVGVTRYCDYPAEVDAIPHVGGGTLESLNQEIILSLQPDLVICKKDTHEPLVRNLERLNVPALALGPGTIAELFDHTELLGRITGHSQSANALVESMQQRIAAVTEAVSAEERPTVFYQVWDDPLMTAGADSYIAELLNLAGGKNLFADSASRYPNVSREVVIARNPDIILAPAIHDAPVATESIGARPGWSQIRAVREGRVYLINGDWISRCGPRLVDALEEIARLLHPKQFAPPSLVSTARDAVEIRESAP